MGVQLNRVVPAAPSSLFRTFSASQPVATHWRRASCEEVQCPKLAGGWEITVPPDSQELATLAAACRGELDGVKRGYGQHFTQPDGMLTYVFPPGQPCLGALAHRVPLDRPAVFRHRDGDWRGGSGRVVVHSSAESWRDELGENQLRLRDQRTRYGVE